MRKKNKGISNLFILAIKKNQEKVKINKLISRDWLYFLLCQLPLIKKNIFLKKITFKMEHRLTDSYCTPKFK